MGLTDDVPLKYTVTIRGIYTTVEKGKVILIVGHSPNPCFLCSKEWRLLRRPTPPSSRGSEWKFALRVEVTTPLLRVEVRTRQSTSRSEHEVYKG